MPASDRPNRRYEEHLTDAELNELIDGTLAASELERAQAHLAGCVECEERYQTLRATVSALQAAPSLMPRRSFQLSPEQAKLPQKQLSWFDRFSAWIVPGVPALRAATLAVALLLLSVTAIDVITHRGDSGENAGPVLMQQAPSQTDQEAPVAQSNSANPTSIPALQESDEEAQSSGGVAPSSARENPSDNAADSMEESDTAGAPEAAAPAMAAQPTEAIAPAAAQSMQEAAPPASPTASPSPIPTATPESTPVPADQSDDSEPSISRWRIAELGLLLLLLWLGVSWFGRTRTHDEDDPSVQ